MGDEPFFAYFAPGATHAPHHVAPEWSAKYKGRVRPGWDRIREESLARQKALGVVPADAELTARPAEIPAWDEMPDDLKPPRQVRWGTTSAARRSSCSASSNIGLRSTSSAPASITSCTPSTIAVAGPVTATGVRSGRPK